MSAVVLAHQGGWDEAAMVLVPLAFLAMLLRVAHVRAGRMDDVDAGPEPEPEPEARDS